MLENIELLIINSIQIFLKLLDQLQNVIIYISV